MQIKSRDEFGQLGESFDQMRGSLRSILQDVSNTSQ
ncbi:HAMP domain-containing protein [Alicyclobacillus dauci]